MKILGGKVPRPTSVLPPGNGGFTLEMAPWKEGQPAKNPSPVLPVAEHKKLADFLLLINSLFLKLKVYYQQCVQSRQVVATAGSKPAQPRNRIGIEHSRTASVDGFFWGNRRGSESCQQMARTLQKISGGDNRKKQEIQREL